MKRAYLSLKSLLLSGLLAGSGLACAADYYVVVPFYGKTVSAAPSISVALSPVALPVGWVGVSYLADLRPSLQVLGDPNFTPSAAAWVVASGELPAGLTLDSTGVISGTASAGAVSSSFQLKATYKSQSALASYNISLSKEYAKFDYAVNMGNGAMDLSPDGRTFTVTGGSNAYPAAQSLTCKSTGKWYFEVDGVATANSYQAVGLARPDTTMLSGGMPTFFYNGLIYSNIGSTVAALNTHGLSGTYGVAWDADSKTVQYYFNGAAAGSLANYGVVSPIGCPAVRNQIMPGGTATMTINSGQAAFKYAVPSGYNPGVY